MYYRLWRDCYSQEKVLWSKPFAIPRSMSHCSSCLWHWSSKFGRGHCSIRLCSMNEWRAFSAQCYGSSWHAKSVSIDFFPSGHDIHILSRGARRIPCSTRQPPYSIHTRSSINYYLSVKRSTCHSFLSIQVVKLSISFVNVSFQGMYSNLSSPLNNILRFKVKC